MDAAHENELARILANRKKGGRLLNAPTSNSSSSGGGGARPNALLPPSQTPIVTGEPVILNPHSPTQPISATTKVLDSVDSGAIVIEEERLQNQNQNQQQQHNPLPAQQQQNQHQYNQYNNQQQPQQQASATFTSSSIPSSPSTAVKNQNPYKVTTDVTSSTVVSRPANNNNNNQNQQEMDRVKRQNEEQARQIEQLQRSLEQMQRNNTINNNNSNTNNSGNFSPNRNIRPPPPQRDNNHQQNNQRSSPSRNSAVENKFDQAANMGLFVRPQRVVSDAGKHYITFKSPSRNTRGSIARSSPQRRNNNNYFTNNGQNFNPTSPSSASFNAATTASGGGRRGGGGNNSRSILQDDNMNDEEYYNNNNENQHQVAVVPPSPYQQSGRSQNGGVGTMKKKRNATIRSGPAAAAAADERVPKPFSNSTLDTNSAMLLLSTGNFFYKLRVRVKTASVIGPASWDIETWEKRWVYLDTNVYMLKWGDKPGGSATIFSHYVPIDDIVKVDMYNQTDPNFGGDGPRVIYYIVLNCVAGGFNARGRGVQKRLCVIATELRDKADMWYDALQSIRGFYQSQGPASRMNARTFSSD